MYEDFFAERLAKLREQKNISAMKMSETLGQNRNYINQIENKKSFPTMQVFFYICEHLGITPKEFFDEGNEYPAQLSALIENLKKLDAKALEGMSIIIQELLRKD